MRWVSKLLALAAAGAVGTTALESSIFTFPVDKQGSQSTVPDRRVVSEDVARSILELRTKSSLASVLGNVERDTVDHLNDFVDGQVPLFGGSDSQESSERNVIVLEGLHRDIGMLMGRHPPIGIRLTSVRFRPGLNLNKGQGNHVVVPHSSSALADDTLGSLVASEKGRGCAYHVHGSGSQTKGAEVREFWSGVARLLLSLTNWPSLRKSVFPWTRSSRKDMGCWTVIFFAWLARWRRGLARTRRHRHPGYSSRYIEHFRARGTSRITNLPSNAGTDR